MPAPPLYLPTIAPSTIEQAINAMIVAGGEGPIAGSVVHRPDREAARSLLDEALREVLTEGWSFNTEHGLEITSTGTISWTGSDGTTETLNIFEPAPNLLSFKVTQSVEQHDLDFVVRPPRDWLGGPLVFYDRDRNRDGFVDRTSLFIDPTWLMDYEDIPQTARNVVFLRALRRFLTQIVGDLAASDRKERDELLAYRALKKEFGAEDRYNLFGNITTARHFGFRFFDQSTVDDRRGNRSGSVGGPGYRTVSSVSLTPATFTLDEYDVEDGLRVATQITLRRQELRMRLSNPNGEDVDQVMVTPANFTLTTGGAQTPSSSITLGATQLNLIAVPQGEVVAEVDVDPISFAIDSTVVPPAPASIVLISSNFTLSATATGYTITAAFANSVNTVAPGGTLNGTVTVNRTGNFTGAVTLSSTDNRITFPSGNTILASQTSVPFVYTAPSNAANGSFSGQILGDATGFPQRAAGFTVQIGTPSIDFSIGSFTTNLAPGFSYQVPINATRTNYNGILYFSSTTTPLNVGSFSEREALANGSTFFIDIQGNGAQVVNRTHPSGPNGYTVFPANVSSSTFFLTIPTNFTGSTVAFSLTILGDGPQAITKNYSFPINTGGVGTSNVVASVQVEPNSFSVVGNTNAPIAASISLGSASVSLTTT